MLNDDNSSVGFWKKLLNESFTIHWIGTVIQETSNFNSVILSSLFRRFLREIGLDAHTKNNNHQICCNRSTIASSQFKEKSSTIVNHHLDPEHASISSVLYLFKNWIKTVSRFHNIDLCKVVDRVNDLALWFV